jgi:hypothetical protein
MTMHWTRGMLWTVVLTVAGMLLGVSPVRAQNVVLYELTESMRIMGAHKAVKRTAAAALAGWAEVGTAVCPRSLATTLGISQCTVNVKAINRIKLKTGQGPIDGTFEVVVQDQNDIDAAEVVVLTGSLDGSMDLSSAITQHAPWGTVTGSWSADGARSGPLAITRNLRGTFSGIFRRPLVVTDPPDCADEEGVTSRCGRVSKPSYVMSDGSLHELRPAEYSLGIPTVRLEISLR